MREKLIQALASFPANRKISLAGPAWKVEISQGTAMASRSRRWLRLCLVEGKLSASGPLLRELTPEEKIRLSWFLVKLARMYRAGR